jgi:hypothetical protein
MPDIYYQGKKFGELHPAEKTTSRTGGMIAVLPDESFRVCLNSLDHSDSDKINHTLPDGREETLGFFRRAYFGTHDFDCRAIWSPQEFRHAIILEGWEMGYVACMHGQRFYAMPHDCRAVLLESDPEKTLFIEGRLSTVGQLFGEMEGHVCYETVEELAEKVGDPRI